MINVIQTLKNLNKEFPRFQLETLIKIVDCIVEKQDYNWYTRTYSNQTSCPPWTITCGSNTATSTYENNVLSNYNEESALQSCETPLDDERFIYTTTTKNHAADKTSHNQVITSAGEQAIDEWLDYKKSPNCTISSTFEKKARR